MSQWKCDRKIKFPNKVTAYKMITKIRKRNGLARKHRDGLDVYFCERHKSYHIGHGTEKSNYDELMRVFNRFIITKQPQHLFAYVDDRNKD